MRMTGERENDFALLLMDALNEANNLEDWEVSSVCTFSNHGLLSLDKGIVLELANIETGHIQNFHLTIQGYEEGSECESCKKFGKVDDNGHCEDCAEV